MASNHSIKAKDLRIKAEAPEKSVTVRQFMISENKNDDNPENEVGKKETKHKSARCEICDRKYNSIWYAREHMRVVHQIDFSLRCPVCERILKT